MLQNTPLERSIVARSFFSPVLGADDGEPVWLRGRHIRRRARRRWSCDLRQTRRPPDVELSLRFDPDGELLSQPNEAWSEDLRELQTMADGRRRHEQSRFVRALYKWPETVAWRRRAESITVKMSTATGDREAVSQWRRRRRRLKLETRKARIEHEPQRLDSTGRWNHCISDAPWSGPATREEEAARTWTNSMSVSERLSETGCVTRSEKTKKRFQDVLTGLIRFDPV